MAPDKHPLTVCAVCFLWLPLNVLSVNLFRTMWKWTVWMKETMWSVHLTHNWLLLLIFFPWLVCDGSVACFQAACSRSHSDPPDKDRWEQTEQPPQKAVLNPPTKLEEWGERWGREKALGRSEMWNCRNEVWVRWNNILGQFHFHSLLFLVVIKHDVHVNLFYLIRNKCVMWLDQCVF